MWRPKLFTSIAYYRDWNILVSVFLINAIFQIVSSTRLSYWGYEQIYARNGQLRCRLHLPWLILLSIPPEADRHQPQQDEHKPNRARLIAARFTRATKRRTQAACASPTTQTFPTLLALARVGGTAARAAAENHRALAQRPRPQKPEENLSKSGELPIRLL